MRINFSERMKEYERDVLLLKQMTPESQKKLTGPIGELLGLIELHRIFGDSALYAWRGKTTKGYDISVNGIKFQIKTCTDDKFQFVIASIPVGNNREKIIQEVTNAPPIFQTINRKIDEGISGANYWILIHAMINSTDIYTLTLEELRECVKEHYKLAIENKAHDKKLFHAYINKHNVYVPRLGANRSSDFKSDFDLLNPFKERTLADLLKSKGLVS